MLEIRKSRNNKKGGNQIKYEMDKSRKSEKFGNWKK